MESGESVIEINKNVDHTTKNVSDKNNLPSRLVQLFPTNIIRSETRKTQFYAKSPKFVPYEPYPAAVKPIVPQNLKKGNKKSRNNMDINTLISQMSQMDTNISEYKPRAKLRSVSEKSINESSDSNIENEEMKKNIEQLLLENENLKEQLKQQVQVFINISIIIITNIYINKNKQNHL